MKYTNPIISGFYPDPSICKVGKDNYLVTSSFEHFPGIPIFHSKDLVNWNQIGHVLTSEKQLQLRREPNYIFSKLIFAPTIRYHNSYCYVITTNTIIRMSFFVRAKHPEGPQFISKDLVGMFLRCYLKMKKFTYQQLGFQVQVKRGFYNQK